MLNIIPLVYLLKSEEFLLGTISVSLLVKTIIILFLVKRGLSSGIKGPLLFVFSMLVSNTFSDFAWFINSVDSCILSKQLDYRYILMFARLGWAFTIIQYQSLSFFLDSLVEPHAFRFKNYQKVFLAISSIFFLFFIGIIFFHFNCYHRLEKYPIELAMQKMLAYYGFLIVIPSIIKMFQNLRKDSLPRILKTQIKLLLYSLILPHLASDFIQIDPLSLSWDRIANNFFVVSTSTTLLTLAVIFCALRILHLRFLNFTSHVKSRTHSHFIDGFKDILEQLSHATSAKELQHLTQLSFKDMFQIPISRTALYVRSKSPPEQRNNISHIENTVENFILLQKEVLDNFIIKDRTLIYDEIAFSNFYEKSKHSDIILNFLDAINADVFIPIYLKQKISGYIIVERFARPNELYSNVEHDEMVVYSSYLANIINLLQTRNIEAVIYREKELQEELYGKHQEINQYKESIRSFLRNYRQKEIGVIFYKNRRFTFANQAAKELIDININLAQGHPITLKLKDLAKKVQEYKAPQNCFIKDKHGQKLVLAAVPHLEQNTIIITVYYPEVSDLVKKQLEALKDPTKWDYLLYLETTESGKLINQLIPGSGEQLLNFKIALLQSALNKKATLLEMPEEDLIPTAKLLHHISLRETLHIIKLTHYSTNNDIPIKLFGINPIFGVQVYEKPLFEKLDNTGTLFIQNIHFLDIETQKYLAEYLMYGMYRTFKSDQKMISNVRIIGSTNKNLLVLVQEGKFSQELFNQLKKHTLSMPSLLTLSEHEIHQLAEGYTEQAIRTDDFKNLLELTQKEKHKIAVKRPISLHELKNKIQQLLLNKSKKNNIYNETQFDPAYETTDPELTAAARLGKHALRDEKTMTLLWNKFHSQSKIASFLGVNRSSINRRCKEYNLR